MRILTHIVTPQEDGLPAGALLRRHFHLSSSLLKAIKWRHGGITLNGQTVPVSARCRPGDKLCADVSDPPCHNPNLHPVPYPLDILFEDEDLLVLNKPAGLTVHCASLTHDPVTVAGAVAYYLHADAFHGVNRLDRGTTGLLVAAKTGYVHARCMELLHSGAFYREYLSVCVGVPSPASGSIDLPIGREDGSLVKRCPRPDGLPAHTDYRVLATQGPFSLVRLRPTTGRTHQLRVHMAAIGCPLAGDWLYGTENPSLISRPALHSYRLHLRHPITGQPLDLTAPLPPDMQRLVSLPPFQTPEDAL